MKVITIASLKGGVGKTTTAVYLSLALAARGKRVLVIDVDPNNNLTDFFLRNTDPADIEERNVKHLLTGSLPVDGCIHESSGLSVIPCTVSLHLASNELSRSPGTILRFASLLRREEFDVVVIDTPPFPGYELAVALHASDMVISPVALSRWTVQAYAALDTEIKSATEGMMRRPESLALPALVTEREETILRDSLNGTPVTASALHRAAAIRSAAEKGAPLRSGTKSETEFMKLSEEVLA